MSHQKYKDSADCSDLLIQSDGFYAPYYQPSQKRIYPFSRHTKDYVVLHESDTLDQCPLYP